MCGGDGVRCFRFTGVGDFRTSTLGSGLGEGSHSGSPLRSRSLSVLEIDGGGGAATGTSIQSEPKEKFERFNIFDL